MKKANRKLLRMVRSDREEWKLRGKFLEKDFREHVRRKYKENQEIADEVYDQAIDGVCDTVDKEQTQNPPEETYLSLYEGWDIKGEYRDGDGGRVAKRLATIDDAEQALALDEQNLAAIMEASAKKHREIVMLRPYWGPGRTKKDAIDAYREEHPDEDIGLSEAG